MHSESNNCQFVSFTAYKRILNQYQIKCNEYNSLKKQYESVSKQCSEFAQYAIKFNNKCDEYNSLKNQYEIVSKQCSEFEQYATKLNNKYTAIIVIIPPTKSNDSNRKSPSYFIQNKAFRNIQSILFEHQNYYFYYDELLKLFDSILKSVGKFRYPLYHCLNAINAVNDYFDFIGSQHHGNRFKLQQMQSITAALMCIVDGKLLNRKLFTQILPSSNRSQTKDVIIECSHRRDKFNKEETHNLCKDYACEKRKPLGTKN